MNRIHTYALGINRITANSLVIAILRAGIK